MRRTQFIYSLAIFLFGGFLTAIGFWGQMSVSADSPQLAGQVEMFTISLIVGVAMIVVSIILFALAISSH
jgi:uncharacterized membrane protein YidH (DUF202 family)